ncbi:hypothetical protein AB0A95_34605 [Micromonospora sp. NPDC049230]|uniref:hypothetical protein n=1 Tax=Micromonospora sp. NPDC049230 TaxID=3155502 RepID=UPI0033C228C0
MNAGQQGGNTLAELRALYASLADGPPVNGDWLLGELGRIVRAAGEPATPPQVWLSTPPPDAPAELLDVLLHWAQENNLDPSRVLDGVQVDFMDGVIRYVELTEPSAPGAWRDSRYGSWKRRATSPLLVTPPEELRRPPVGHATPRQPTEEIRLVAVDPDPAGVARPVAYAKLTEPSTPGPGQDVAYDWARYKRTCAPDHRLYGHGDLALFLGGSGDSFTGRLLDLIAKGQWTPTNMAALERGFPREVHAWRVWMPMSPSPTAAELCAKLTGDDA